MIDGVWPLKLNVIAGGARLPDRRILGGYTTFSTFSLDSALLIERHAYVSAALYVSGSALLSILALFAGMWLMRSHLCLKPHASTTTMTASAWTAGSSGIIRR